MLLVAWCELREDFRHFRTDRMMSCEPGEDRFVGQGDGLRQQWQALESSK